MNKTRITQQITEIEHLIKIGNVIAGQCDEESQGRLLDCIANHINIIKEELEEDQQ